ncbi:MAG: hypothetical protein JNK65_00285, partial [Deltaproteobacteria bacterium]|nr:hypothetical protein [Deltaproteobacteria bacterium]
MKMQNQSFFLKLISRLLIFIYLTQGVFIPSVYAQRGIFVRESEMTKDDNGKSFRTNIPEEDPASLGAQIPGGLSGKAGAGSVDSLSQQKNSNDPLGSTSSLSGA